MTALWTQAFVIFDNAVRVAAPLSTYLEVPLKKGSSKGIRMFRAVMINSCS